MQRLVMVRYDTKPDLTEENERLARAVLAELRADAPDHITYALFRRDDSFVHLFVNAKEPDSTEVIARPVFKAYLADLRARCVAPPEQIRLDLDLLDAYGLVAALAPT